MAREGQTLVGLSKRWAWGVGLPRRRRVPSVLATCGHPACQGHTRVAPRVASLWVVVGPSPPWFARRGIAPPRRLDTGEHVTYLLSQAMTCKDTTRSPVQLD